MTNVRGPFKIQRNISHRSYLTIEAIRENFRWKQSMYILRSGRLAPSLRQREQVYDLWTTKTAPRLLL